MCVCVCVRSEDGTRTHTHTHTPVREGGEDSLASEPAEGRHTRTHTHTHTHTRTDGLGRTADTADVYAAGAGRKKKIRQVIEIVLPRPFSCPPSPSPPSPLSLSRSSFLLGLLALDFSATQCGHSFSCDIIVNDPTHTDTLCVCRCIYKYIYIYE